MTFRFLRPVAVAILAFAAVERTVSDEVATQTWWSLKPIVKAVPPNADDREFAEWSRSPIDRFLYAQLKAKGLAPSPPASRRDWIRRVHFDLIGLPPTPAEVDRFVADSAPDAFENVVDRLLASPHFGERWARHWMDVIHWAETHGHDQDVPRDNAWPYRDWLIRSFNDDKPYARIVKEQIAGDVLYPGDPQATIALGFLAAGPWDESSLKDIREDSIDRKAAQYIDRDDMAATVGLSMLSLTVQCARCHDHKADPITSREYYGLQAVFAGVDRADRLVEVDPASAAKRKTLLARKARLQTPTDDLKDILADMAVFAEVEAWERRQGTDPWTILEPRQFASQGGSTVAKLPDGSLLFGGVRGERDVYVVETEPESNKIAAVRLEVLTHESLPHQGPGRQDNGNLHLNEIELEVLKGSDRKPIPIARAFADFDQEGWDVAKAIDRQPTTAWGIYPAVGKSHAAVFVLKEPLTPERGAKLVFTLRQTHGQGHLIGRPRFSATDAVPTRDAAASSPVRPILAKKPADRTEGERRQLARHVLLLKVEEDLAALPTPTLVYAAASEFAAQGSFRPTKGACRPVHVLRRGDIKHQGIAAAPGALSCVSSLKARFDLKNPDDEGQRRAALAEWVADPKNPLTWRSIVNRVWHHHLGRGIVASTNDFGKMGALPSHPELLDWLAATLLEEGGSLKKLHRRIVLSAAYRQSSKRRPEAARIDADNVYLWRMQSRRLDAESIRDAVLAVSGKLDPTMGGPSVRHFKQSPGIHRTPKVDYASFDPDGPGAHRRSVYRFVFRTVPDPFMDALDCPDASQFAPGRAESTTALQALALLNDAFMVRMSEHFASRFGDGPLEARVRQAWKAALGREPTASELAVVVPYAERHGMANACRLLLNCNEFVFVP